MTVESVAYKGTLASTANPERSGRLSAPYFRRHFTCGAGFTLIEVLVVISIISILAALIFPVFASVRGSARRTACLSNLRQLGSAVTLYTDEYDGQYPWGADPADLDTAIWSATPYAAVVPTMPHLETILDPYVRAPAIWRCPSDYGFKSLDLVPTGFPAVPLNATPSCYDAFQVSYFYRTEVALLKVTAGQLAAHDPGGPPGAHGPAEINILMDANGSWHGSAGGGRRYNALMADGHVVSSNLGRYLRTWSLVIDNGG